jgi:sulfoxide reductase heme-binding subunit YedZ
MQSINQEVQQRDRLRQVAKILLCIPAVVTAIQAMTGNLTANPIQAAIQRSGDTAIILLALSLSITPLKALTGWIIFSPLRKVFGLFSFYYAAGHLILFAVFDYGFDLALLIDSIPGKPYILVGLTVFFILLAMALTSNRWSKQRLGKNWKRLHRLVYLAGLLAGLHFAWALKGDIFRLSGNIFWPVIYLAIVSSLLLLRFPWIRHKLADIFPNQVK